MKIKINDKLAVDASRGVEGGTMKIVNVGCKKIAWPTEKIAAWIKVSRCKDESLAALLSYCDENEDFAAYDAIHAILEDAKGRAGWRDEGCVIAECALDEYDLRSPDALAIALEGYQERMEDARRESHE
jgi:hypothetical protein